MGFVHTDILNDYEIKIVDQFLDKCKANGSYKRVYEDFEDGTSLLEDAVENISDVCALLYLTYDKYAFDRLEEWKKDGFDYAWELSTENKLSYEEVLNELNKMFKRS